MIEELLTEVQLMGELLGRLETELVTVVLCELILLAVDALVKAFPEPGFGLKNGDFISREGGLSTHGCFNPVRSFLIVEPTRSPLLALADLSTLLFVFAF